jgi:hypothetical protein
MSGIFIVITAIILLIGCGGGILLLPGKPAARFGRVVLGFAGCVLLLWLIWMGIMVFGVGPAMKQG